METQWAYGKAFKPEGPRNNQNQTNTGIVRRHIDQL